MNNLTISKAISSFSVKPKGSMSILLGAGASVSSGIKSSKNMVWDFKRKIFCLEQKIPESKIGDLSEKTKQDEIQFYFNDFGKHPKQNVEEEYRYYSNFPQGICLVAHDKYGISCN